MPTQVTSRRRPTRGSWKPGQIPPGAVPWKPGQSGNPGGMPRGARRGLNSLLSSMGELLADEDCGPLLLARLKQRAREDPDWVLDTLLIPLLLRAGAMKVELSSPPEIGEQLSELIDTITEKRTEDARKPAV